MVEDLVIAEEPLEIIITFSGENTPLATTMRTPGHDLYLTLGYLRSEGISPFPDSIDRPEEGNNTVLLHYKFSLPKGLSASHRIGLQSSSCGLCGKVSIEDLLEQQYPSRTIPTRRWLQADLDALYTQLSQQPLFLKTGGSHAVWLFNEENELIATFEDVGRHNALDKLLGWVALEEIVDLENMTLVLSSRLSYELVHKAGVLGVWVVIALGAPSSLAVELSSKLDLTTLGFFKKESYNLYTNRHALLYDPA